MKYQTLRIAASCLGILAWLSAVVGIVITIIIGIGSATVIAKISFLLGGFALTAICVLMLIVASKLIYLFIDMEDDLSEIADSVKEKR
jgi:hypothetical protein